jgi:hypothetical protein
LPLARPLESAVEIHIVLFRVLSDFISTRSRALTSCLSTVDLHVTVCTRVE